MTTPPYPLHPQPVRNSWLEQHPHWKIPLGCLTLVLLIALFGLILMTIVTSAFRSSDVYKQAIAEAGENPQIKDQIGEPIKVAWLVSGQMNVSGSTGSASLSIPITGPKGKGKIRAVAFKSGGVWRFTLLQVNVEGKSETIDLLSVQPPPERVF
jgi:Cytochrome oxidase complex assembly protein 1